MGSTGGLAGRQRCELTEFIGRRGELALGLRALGLAVLRRLPLHQWLILKMTGADA